MHPQRDKYWENVELMQTAIKSKNGQGKMILCNFTAEIDKNEPEERIKYKVKDFDSDFNLLKVGDDYQYTLKKIHEMA